MVAAHGAEVAVIYTFQAVADTVHKDTQAVAVVELQAVVAWYTYCISNRIEL
jgi:hypothetical protein